MNWLQKIAAISEPGQQKLTDYGFNPEPVESITLGEYELYLIHHPQADMYEIGLQRSDLDFTDEGQQSQRIPMEGMPDPAIVYEMIDVLKRWISQYGRLYLGSHNEEKTQKYVRILSSLGLNPQRENLYGMDVAYIE